MQTLLEVTNHSMTGKRRKMFHRLLFGCDLMFCSSLINALLLLFLTEHYASEVYAIPNEVGKQQASVRSSDLSAPLDVTVKELTPESVNLTWTIPPVPSNQPTKLFTYLLTLTPLTLWGNGREKEFSLPPTITSKQVMGMQEGTQYAVQLSAVYGDPSQKISRNKLLVVSAPKFTISIPSTLQRDVPVGDDGLPPGEPACNCSEAGMLACTRRAGFVECTCQHGYTGTWCEECAPGNFLVGKECRVCPCSNTTSSAECVIDDSGEVRCTECLPGHRGSLCTSCTAGYRWTDERCMALDCLSSSLCAEQRNAPGCEECLFLQDHFPAPAQRSNSDRSLGDGTLPLIAVVVTLGILLLVAAMATCYRYWTYRRHQPRIPFWSIELQDDKSDLHAHCQYQHLDAATNRAVNEVQQEGSTAISAAGEGGRLTTEPVPRTYNTINV